MAGPRNRSFYRERRRRVQVNIGEVFPIPAGVCCGAGSCTDARPTRTGAAWTTTLSGEHHRQPSQNQCLLPCCHQPADPGVTGPCPVAGAESHDLQVRSQWKDRLYRPALPGRAATRCGAHARRQQAVGTSTHWRRCRSRTSPGNPRARHQAHQWHERTAILDTCPAPPARCKRTARMPRTGSGHSRERSAGTTRRCTRDDSVAAARHACASPALWQASLLVRGNIKPWQSRRWPPAP